jgi:hypothetical protein
MRRSAQKLAASIAKIGNVNAPKNDLPALIVYEQTTIARMQGILERARV